MLDYGLLNMNINYFNDMDNKRLKRVPDTFALPDTNRIGMLRRWLGIYNKQEREILYYAKAVRRETVAVLTGQKHMPLRRPEWMHFEDYARLRKFANKAQQKRRK